MISLMFPKSFTSEQATLYGYLLSDIPKGFISKAVEMVLKKSKFVPSVAEIREQAESLYRTSKGVVLSSAGKGWEAVDKAIRKVGMNREPKFNDEITDKVVRQMGWKSICLAPVESTSILRGQFIKLYNEAVDKQKKEIRNRRALGIQPLTKDTKKLSVKDRHIDIPKEVRDKLNLQLLANSKKM